jgi:8-oxo-dGTP pyrophosphatase MutT (NUDIX family)
MPERLRELQAALLARAQSGVPADSVPVVIGGVQVGVATPQIAAFLTRNVARFEQSDSRLKLRDEDLDFFSRTAVLADAAMRLKDAGLTWGWRNEPLDVRTNPELESIATIERVVCRTLGINTVAVHLNAFASDGRLWVARRSPLKAIDPGLWDNLVGGMVPAGESEREALAREAWEEAGLDVAGWAIDRGGRVQIQRPVPEGFMSETVQIFDTILSADAAPRNIDGEVAAIELRAVEDVVAGIARGEFTLESSLVTLDALLRRAPSALT